MQSRRSPRRADRDQLQSCVNGRALHSAPVHTTAARIRRIPAQPEAISWRSSHLPMSHLASTVLSGGAAVNTLSASEGPVGEPVTRCA